jgi:hypothetical protein
LLRYRLIWINAGPERTSQYALAESSPTFAGGEHGNQIKADFAKGVLTAMPPNAAPAVNKTIEVKQAA